MKFKNIKKWTWIGSFWLPFKYFNWRKVLSEAIENGWISKEQFFRQLFNYLKTNIEAHDNNGFGLESFVDFVGYDGESNSIVVSKNEPYSDYTDDGVVRVKKLTTFLFIDLFVFDVGKVLLFLFFVLLYLLVVRWFLITS